MLPYLTLGPIGLPVAPLIYILGAWVSLFAVDRAARRLGQDNETMYALGTVALIAGFVGARLAFVLLHWSSFDDNLLGIIWPLNSGYNGFGGVLIALASVFFYARWKQLDLWVVLDVLAPGIIIWLMFASMADFLGGPGYGTVTFMPWGISQFGISRHPVQLYEIAVGLAALLAWWLTTSVPRRGADGRAFLWTAAVYSGGRLFVEAFRDNTWYVAAGVRAVQVICLVIMIASLIILARVSMRTSANAAVDLPPQG